MATENLENIAPFNTESNSEVSKLSDISKDHSIHSALKHQKASQAQQTMTIAELSKVQLLQDLPSRVKDDANFIYRKKGDPNTNKKTGEISIYFICLKCSKMLIFDWTAKKIKDNRKKLTSQHSCKLTDHTPQKFTTKIEGNKLLLLEEQINKVPKLK